MAYSPLVPNANNTVGADLTAMQENFSLLESAQVVDEGSTADGDYVRWENGLQVCFITNTGLNFENPSNIRYQWYFPVSFLTTPFVRTSYHDNSFNVKNYSSLSEYQRNLSKVSVEIGISSLKEFTVSDPLLDNNISGYAIGRWK